MKMRFQQRMFSWFCSYDVYDEAGDTLYTVKGQLSWGHCLKIFDKYGAEVATVRERVLTFLPCFELYLGESHIGTIRREFTLFKPSYTIDFNRWYVEGNYFEWDYEIRNSVGEVVAVISKELFNWTDTYTISVCKAEDALPALMLVVAIDAEKCSRRN